MLNQVVLVGVIEEMPHEVKWMNGERRIQLNLRVERPFRNSNGIYEQDVFVVDVWRGIADQTKELCHVGDMIAVKGRLGTNVDVHE